MYTWDDYLAELEMESSIEAEVENGPFSKGAQSVLIPIRRNPGNEILGYRDMRTSPTANKIALWRVVAAAPNKELPKRENRARTRRAPARRHVIVTAVAGQVECFHNRYPACRTQPSKSDGTSRSDAASSASSRASCVRALAFRTKCLSLDQHSSIGLRSGEYGGIFMMKHPAASTAAFTAGLK